MTTLDPWNYTLIRRAVFPRTPVTILVLHHQRFARAMHDDVLILFREFFPLHIEWNGVFFGNGFEHALKILRVGRAPRSYGSLQNGQLRVRNDEFFFNFVTST